MKASVRGIEDVSVNVGGGVSMGGGVMRVWVAYGCKSASGS